MRKSIAPSSLIPGRGWPTSRMVSVDRNRTDPARSAARGASLTMLCACADRSGTRIRTITTTAAASPPLASIVRRLSRCRACARRCLRSSCSLRYGAPIARSVGISHGLRARRLTRPPAFRPRIAAACSLQGCEALLRCDDARPRWTPRGERRSPRCSVPRASEAGAPPGVPRRVDQGPRGCGLGRSLRGRAAARPREAHGRWASGARARAVSAPPNSNERLRW